MKRIFIFTLVLVLCCGLAFTQVLSKKAFRFESDPLPGLKSNSITDIVAVDENTIILGTGKGLAITRDGGESWVTYTHKQGIGRGGVSAVAVKDSMIWIATAFDSLVNDEHYAAGGGLSYSTDLGATWTHLPQPLPGNNWTVINNVTYDIAIIDTTVWIASFGGGLMKSSDMGKSWQVRPPDDYNFNPDEYLSHRVFSLLAVGDTLWVGTAGGINVSYDGGKTWPREMMFTHQNQDQPISGNFVVAIDLQEIDDKKIIWAATINAEDYNEFRGVSRTEDFGRSWTNYLRGKFSYDFAFDENQVFAATDSGLWKSPDGGLNWDVFPQIVDYESREHFYTEAFYSVEFSKKTKKELWVGSGDGLARTANNGLDWTIFRSFVKPGQGDEPRVYAYPNPFTPLRFNQFGGDGFIRFQFRTFNAARATIRIFDFAMERIATIDGGSWAANSDCSIAWNCRDNNDRLLANGVYFYQLELEGDGKYWGKIIIID
ncbi:MAG TPA: hypothetical protein ENN22_16650 [bacterium]|nr:hypothetical protein [bacterium]